MKNCYVHQTLVHFPERTIDYHCQPGGSLKECTAYWKKSQERRFSVYFAKWSWICRVGAYRETFGSGKGEQKGEGGRQKSCCIVCQVRYEGQSEFDRGSGKLGDKQHKRKRNTMGGRKVWQMGSTKLPWTDGKKRFQGEKRGMSWHWRPLFRGNFLVNCIRDDRATRNSPEEQAMNRERVRA